MARSDRDVTDTASASTVGEIPEPPRAAGREGAAPAIRPGECLGRYTIRGLIGAGGMGSVFAAVDPELGRTVAIKLIRSERTPSAAARARLRREAQALARLRHPNVVTVYDVGTQGEQVFIAMEHIEGATMGEWLGAAPRGWREVLARFLAAGRGLAAAHARGIVHRDFKPANVMVGEDRVVVVDFGLARGADDLAEPEAGGQSGPLEVSVTLTGERVGTPLYMAPEQRSGGAITARTDQYSFCVALWEGLHGECPPDKPRRSEVPGWLNTAVLRGLAKDPDARWPSMDALLAALGRDPARRRRQILAAAGVIALVGAGTWSVVRARSNQCAGAGARLLGVWDAPRKEAVRRAFAASKVPYAEDSWRRVSARIDEYVAGWSHMQVDACRATRVEGRQSDSLMDLRMSCLERHRAELGALTDLWSHGMDTGAVEHAGDAATKLAALSDCADTRALTERAPLPGDPAVVARIAAARRRIDAAHALDLANRLSEAKTAALAARAEADATGWPQVRAEAAYALGDILIAVQEPTAEAPLLDALRWAFAARDDRLAARAAIGIVANLANEQQNASRALTVADIAEGVVARIDDDRLRSKLLHYRGDALRTQSKFEAARAAYAEAYELALRRLGPNDDETLANRGRLSDVLEDVGKYKESIELGELNLAATISILGPGHPRVSSQLNNLGITADSAGDLDAAVSYYRRALAIREKVFAPDSMPIAGTLNNLAVVEMKLGQLKESESHLLGAQAALSHIFGPDHVQVSRVLVNLGTLRRKQGRYDEGIALDERALAVKTKAYGPMHANVALNLAELGDIIMAKGDAARALPVYRRALEIREKTLGAEHGLTVSSKVQIALALAALGRCAEAQPLVTEVTPVLEKSLGAEHPYVADALRVGARCDLAEGRAAAAAARLDRILAIYEKIKVDPVDRGAARWLQARALWALGRHDAARAAAGKAEDELGGGADGARDRAAAHAWLASHN